MSSGESGGLSLAGRLPGAVGAFLVRWGHSARCAFRVRMHGVHALATRVYACDGNVRRNAWLASDGFMPVCGANGRALVFWTSFQVSRRYSPCFLMNQRPNRVERSRSSPPSSLRYGVFPAKTLELLFGDTSASGYLADLSNNRIVVRKLT